MIIDLHDAVETLRALPECNRKIGTVGYCLGGYLAYRLAVSDSVDAAVGYYGGTIDQHLDRAKDLHCPLMLHFGEKDHHIPLTSVERIREALTDKGHVEIFVYKGAEHGFNCEQRPSYDRQAAMLAFARSMMLLKQSLT